MKILVTGGAGFIGSNIVDAYVNAGHSVWVLDNETAGDRKNVHKKANYAKIDVRNFKGLKKIFQKGKFDVVNHHAAQIDVRHSVLNPHHDAAVNITGTLNLLELSRQFKVKKFIFSSSGGTVYGECPRPARETNPTEPHSPYGVSKLAAEKYIQAYGLNFRLKYTIFRYSNVYGPRQDPFGEAGVVAIFSKNLLIKKQSLIYGDGRQTRDFVFVGDVVKANLLALSKGNNCVLNIASQKLTSVNELYNQMARMAGFKKSVIKKPARQGELFRSILDISRAKKLLHWKPQIILKEGLTQTINYFADRLI